MSTAREVRLYHRLQRAAHAATKHADRRMRPATGLTTAQVSVLSVIAADGPASQRHIARVLGVNESAVTPMVGRLEAAGCLRKRRDDADRRAWVLELTSGGRRSLQAAGDAFGPVNEAIERALTDDEITQAASLLERLAAAFDDARRQGGDATP